MKIRLDASNPVNLEVTLCCGQAFRWEKHGEWWYGVADEKILKIRQVGEELEVRNADTDFAKNYFGLDDGLTEILSRISKDDHIKQAIEMFRGLRILRQDPWECLISFICATYKNVAAIKQMLLNLCCRFGDRTYLDNYEFYTFPTPERLTEASEAELAECSLGYRAKYVHETARMVSQDQFDLEHLRRTSYEEARKALQSFPGVGPKAADCILLFSLGRFEAFPIDVWIRRAILKHYAGHFPKDFMAKIKEQKTLTRSEYEKLSLFGRSYFGEFAGYAQEYLYHYERTTH